MKKIIILLTSFMLVFYSISFALTAMEVKNKVENVYSQITPKLKTVYNKYIKDYNLIKNKFSTGDYKILLNFVDPNLTGLKNDIDDRYLKLLNEIIDKKYNLVASIDDAKNKYDAGIISSGDYESKLNNVLAELSGFQATYNTKILDLDSTLSGDIINYNLKIKKLLNDNLSKISKYKDIENKITELKKTYSLMEENKKKLEKIIGISNELIKEKSQSIKNDVNSYFSGYVEKEFKKYVQEDENMTYFNTGMQIKKQLIIGFISDKLDSTIQNTVKNYMPTNIDFNSIESGYNNIISINIAESLKNYADTINSINTLSSKIKSADEELQKYLEKFQNNTDKENVLKVLKQDIINSLKGVTKIVQDDIKQTFDSRMAFVKTEEKQEQTLIEAMNKVYEENINSTKLEDLNNLKTTLESYKSVLVLPKNKELVNSLIDIVNEKIKELKNKQILDKIANLSTQIDALPIGNDFTKIENLRKEIQSLELPENLKNKKEILLSKLKMKENLNKLFVSGAIRYYYTKGDLTDKVASILEKIYQKYKKQGKEKIFMEKINKAFDKLDILEENLKNDLRTYYIIMIHNGLIKFKMNLKNNG